MNQTSKISKKSIKNTIILGMLALSGCCSPLAQKNKDNDHTESKLTLIGKRSYQPSQSFTPEAVLYFDADGNPNTTEFILHRSICCPTSDAKFFDAKIGDKKTASQWVEQLEHKKEHPYCSYYLKLFNVNEIQ